MPNDTVTHDPNAKPRIHANHLDPALHATHFPSTLKQKKNKKKLNSKQTPFHADPDASMN